MDLHPAPTCEYTKRKAKTEGVDCPADATKRHVRNSDGVTVGVFCTGHSRENDSPEITIEDISVP